MSGIWLFFALVFVIASFLWLVLFNDGFSIFMSIVLALVGVICAFISIDESVDKFNKNNTITSTYYLEAEVLATDTIHNITVFTTEQGKYTSDGVYYDICPYLLTMNPNDTKDANDDEILVVWRTVE